MVEIRPLTSCFLCGIDHGRFKEWQGPDICEQCWEEELFLDGQKIVAIEEGKVGAPTLVWVADGTCLTFGSIRKVREAIFQEKLGKQRVAR